MILLLPLIGDRKRLFITYRDKLLCEIQMIAAMTTSAPTKFHFIDVISSAMNLS